MAPFTKLRTIFYTIKRRFGISYKSSVHDSFPIYKQIGSSPKLTEPIFPITKRKSKLLLILDNPKIFFNQ